MQFILFQLIAGNVKMHRAWKFVRQKQSRVTMNFVGRKLITINALGVARVFMSVPLGQWHLIPGKRKYFNVTSAMVNRYVLNFVPTVHSIMSMLKNSTKTSRLTQPKRSSS